MSIVTFQQIIILRGCGIDIHKDIVVTTISGEGLKTETRSYKTFSSSLTELKRMVIIQRHYSCGNGEYRCGRKRVLIAVGHLILKSIRHVLKYTCKYKELGTEYLIQRIGQKRKIT